MNRPETTLFLLMSVDGKISTGDTDALDFDRDLHRIPGVQESLHQYYDLERQTDLFSLNTGRVMAKAGVNERTDEPTRLPVQFVIIDNQPHLTLAGVNYLAKKVTQFIVATSNPQHPALASTRENVVVLSLPQGFSLGELLERLRGDHGIQTITVQSGGTLNAALFREGLIDHLSLVVAPLVVGGATTPTVADGDSIRTLDDLKRVVVLTLVEARRLEDSYLHLRYDVIHASSND